MEQPVDYTIGPAWIQEWDGFPAPEGTSEHVPFAEAVSDSEVEAQREHSDEMLQRCHDLLAHKDKMAELAREEFRYTLSFTKLESERHFEEEERKYETRIKSLEMRKQRMREYIESLEGEVRRLRGLPPGTRLIKGGKYLWE